MGSGPLQQVRKTQMIVSPEAVHIPTGHYCPVCLRHIPETQAERRNHREPCRSGDLDVALLHCPICGIVLAAEIDSQAASLAAHPS